MISTRSPFCGLVLGVVAVVTLRFFFLVWFVVVSLAEIAIVVGFWFDLIHSDCNISFVCLFVLLAMRTHALT